MKRKTWLLLFLGLIAAACHRPLRWPTMPFGAPSKERLISELQQLARQPQEGLPPLDLQAIRQLIQSERVVFLPAVLARRLDFGGVVAETSFLWYLSPATLQEELSFLRRHRALLEEVAARSHLPPSLWVALFMMESNLGREKPLTHLASALFSVAVADQPGVAASILGTEAAETQRERLVQKAKQAKIQLLYLVALGTEPRFSLSPLALKGSYAGAFGIPQFLPESCYRYGEDADGDGRVDIFQLKDALFSAARHFQAKGFVPEGKGDGVPLQPPDLTRNRLKLVPRPASLLAKDRVIVGLFEEYRTLRKKIRDLKPGLEKEKEPLEKRLKEIRDFEVSYYQELASYYGQTNPDLFLALMHYNRFDWYAAAILENSRLIELLYVN